MSLSARNLLHYLSRMPFIDSVELALILGEPHATVHRSLTGLLADGIAGRVSHGTAHLPPSHRYFLTAQGIRDAAEVLDYDTPSDFVRAYPMSREWLTLLIRRMDAVASVYRLAASMSPGIDGLRSRVEFHHTDRGERPPNPTLANGAPLSVRMALGRPYSRKARSRTRLAAGPVDRSSPAQTSRYRDAASWTVSGSIRVPSEVRNHPLKSIDHTSFGRLAPEKGSPHGVLRRLRRRRFTSPARSSRTPAVLGDGHDCSGAMTRSRPITFLGPHNGYARFIAMIRSTSAGGVAVGR